MVESKLDSQSSSSGWDIENIRKALKAGYGIILEDREFPGAEGSQLVLMQRAQDGKGYLGELDLYPASHRVEYNSPSRVGKIILNDVRKIEIEGDHLRIEASDYFYLARASLLIDSNGGFSLTQETLPGVMPLDPCQQRLHD